jgi:hypothetical protein
MVKFWLDMMGSAAIASFVIAAVMVYEQLDLLSKPRKGSRNRSEDGADHPPTED